MAKKRTAPRRSVWRALLLGIVPHQDNHYHPHAIRHSALALYVAIILTFNVGYNVFVAHSPKVLGFATSISQHELIRLTNVERAKVGAPAVRENSLLNRSAMEKAKNMFAEDYWAHYAPSGKSPWYWYDQVGYAYTLAGENLARDFDTSQGVINGWMNSKSHRENMLSSGYRDIGIAVLNGRLGGQETTLVVQHFGTRANSTPAAPPSGSVKNSGSPSAPSSYTPTHTTPNNQPVVEEAQITEQPGENETLGGVAGVPAHAKEELSELPYRLLNPMPVSGWSTQQVVVVALLGGLMLLFIFDFAVLHRQGVHRPNSHSLLHAGMMGAALIVVLFSTSGGIL